MTLSRGIGVSFTDRLRKVGEDLDQIRTVFLKDMAQEVVNSSPVDTGTYVMSHNVGEQSAAGQFTGNINYIGPPNQDPTVMRNAALAKLNSQIDSLPVDQTRVNLSNNSAHSRIVETGPSWRREGYFVYSRAREMAPILLDKAVRQVRGS